MALVSWTLARGLEGGEVAEISLFVRHFRSLLIRFIAGVLLVGIHICYYAYNIMPR